MIDFAPGMRTIIRDEEWMIKKIETNSLGNRTLYCVGISPLVKDREAIFLTDLEQIQIVNPAEVKLIADVSPFYKRALLYLESQWRQQIPTDANLHIGHKAAMDLMKNNKDISYGYKFIDGNIGTSEEGIITLPLYMIAFFDKVSE